jgi:hypothetical protein
MTVVPLRRPDGLIAYLTELLARATAGEVDGVVAIVQANGAPAVSFVGQLDAGSVSLGLRLAETELDRRLDTSAAPAS